MIERNFGDLQGVLAIHDDIIISAKTHIDHDRIFQQVLQRARDRNIKFNIRKIQFRISQVKYLGNIISKEGLQLDPEKVIVQSFWHLTLK